MEDLVQFLLVLAVLAAVVAVVSAPLRRAGSPDAPPAEPDSGRAALEAAKEAKYREIRDAELDHRTGKLSEADWRDVDARLRAEAMEILRRLDEAGGD
ncbi:MAG TPA: hypothetical protein VNB64_00475 [Solirubrobacteraceae bacterium]|nr:hypothetical protein [Solirubrobacteraceae bacterium]